MKETKYYVNDIFLNVVEEGPPDGEVLLFLHGFPEFWYGWKNQISYFSERGFKVVVPDQRGYNLSDKPYNVHQYRLAVLIKDVVCLIQTLGEKKIIVIGHDWGGIVAWGLAEKHPELIKKLIILNAPHPEVMKKIWKNNLRQLIKSWYILFFQLPILPEWVLRYNNFSFLRTTLSPGPGKGVSGMHDIEKYTASWTKDRCITSMLHWYRAAKLEEAFYNRVIECPVLIMWGMLDAALVADLAEKNTEYCSDAKIIYYEDATHWLHHEISTLVNENMEEFIKVKNDQKILGDKEISTIKTI